MFEACEEVVAEYTDVEQKLADPAIHADQNHVRRLGRRFAELRPIVATYREWQQLTEDVVAAQELAGEDSGFADEAAQLSTQLDEVAEKLRLLLVPRDPMDSKDVILEVKAGEGGAESALFAADLLRMRILPESIAPPCRES